MSSKKFLIFIHIYLIFSSHPLDFRCFVIVAFEVSHIWLSSTHQEHFIINTKEERNACDIV